MLATHSSSFIALATFLKFEIETKFKNVIIISEVKIKITRNFYYEI